MDPKKCLKRSWAGKERGSQRGASGPTALCGGGSSTANSGRAWDLKDTVDAPAFTS